MAPLSLLDKLAPPGVALLGALCGWALFDANAVPCVQAFGLEGECWEFLGWSFNSAVEAGVFGSAAGIIMGAAWTIVQWIRKSSGQDI